MKIKRVDTSLFGLFILSCLPLILSSALLYFVQPDVWPDEAFMIDMAKTFLKEGKIATDLFAGYAIGLEKEALWYPPFYFFTLSFWIRFFGETVFSARALSLLFAFGSLALIFATLKKIFKKNVFPFLGTFLIALDVAFAQSAKTGRMEMMNFFFMTLGIAVICFMEVNKLKKDYLYLVLGIISGFSVLTHPLGGILPAILISYVLLTTPSIRGKLFNSLLIGIPALFFLSIWFLSIADWNMFLLQNSLQIQRKLITEATAITLFNENFIHRLLFVLYATAGLGLLRQVLLYKKNLDILFLLGLAMSFAVSIWGKEMWYLVYFQPFISICLLSLIRTLNLNKEKLLARSFIVIFSLLLLSNLYLSVELIQNSREKNYYKFAQAVQKHLAPGSSVFLSVIPDPYFSLEKSGLKIIEFPTVPVSNSTYKSLLDEIDYAVINGVRMPDTNNSKFLENYLLNNKSSIELVDSGGYQVEIIKLIPKNQRR